MTPRAVFVPLLLLGAAIAQDSAPIPLTGKNAAAVCHGKAKHAPGCVVLPRATYRPSPGLPKDLKARRDGTVVLSLVVGTDGLPHEIKVDRPLNPELDEEPMKAVTKWRFDPATQDGKPVAVQINVEVTFRY